MVDFIFNILKTDIKNLSIKKVPYLIKNKGLFIVIYTNLDCLIEALTNSTNNGCGAIGFDFSSG